MTDDRNAEGALGDALLAALTPDESRRPWDEAAPYVLARLNAAGWTVTRCSVTATDDRPPFCSDATDHCLRGDCGQCRGEPSEDDLDWLRGSGYLAD